MVNGGLYAVCGFLVEVDLKAVDGLFELELDVKLNGDVDGLVILAAQEIVALLVKDDSLVTEYVEVSPVVCLGSLLVLCLTRLSKNLFSSLATFWISSLLREDSTRLS